MLADVDKEIPNCYIEDQSKHLAETHYCQLSYVPSKCNCHRDFN